MEKVIKISVEKKQASKYASCQRLVLEDLSFFDLTMVCATGGDGASAEPEGSGVSSQ